MSGRILLADDLATNRVALRVKLAAAQYDVSVVANGQELLEEVEKTNPDLLILDNRLSDISGPDLCRRIRSTGPGQQISILVLAENPDPDCRLAALRAGADDILEKPVSEVGLMARARSLLRTREVRAETERRKKTAASFGFSEAGSDFEPASRVLLISDEADLAAAWATCLSRENNAIVETRSAADALVQADGTTTTDAYVIDSEVSRSGGGLALLSDLRSRSGSRLAAMMFAEARGDDSSGATALDFGASDVFPRLADPRELALRLKTQLRRKRDADMLRRNYEYGMMLAATDPLTGLFNRRYAMSHLENILNEATRTDRPVTVMIADIDHFKMINDRHGHATGDAVLRQVASCLRDRLRGEDMVARLGGEEFLIVMPDTDESRARPAASRLCTMISQFEFVSETDGRKLPVTMSLGVAVGCPSVQQEDPHSLLARADRALYRAKAEGRNKISIGVQAA